MDQIRLLVVEDDVSLAKAMTGALSDYGYEITVAQYVNEAIELLASDSFHVLIADWILERQLGKVVMEFARASTPELPIICFSAHTTTDSECAHWADEFVLKSSTGADRLRSAIIRRLNLNHSRSLFRASADEDSISSLDAFARKVLDPNLLVFGKSLICWSELPSLSRDLLTRIIPFNYVGDFNEIDCAVPEFEMAQVVGRCELAGERSILVRGCLDTIRPNWCLLRNVDALSPNEQKELAKIIADRQVQRIGSPHKIPIECFVGISANPKKPIVKELSDVATQSCSIPSPTLFYCYDSESSLQESERNRSSKETDVSPTGTYAHVEACSVLSNPSEAVQSIGPRVFAEWILKVGSESESKKSWKDVERVAKLLYLGQVLGKTNGNVSLAAKWSGLRRNAIYDLLREFKLDPQAFRHRGISTNRKRAVGD